MAACGGILAITQESILVLGLFGFVDLMQALLISRSITNKRSIFNTLSGCKIFACLLAISLASPTTLAGHSE